MVEEKPETQTTQLLQQEGEQVAGDSPMTQHQSCPATMIIDNELNDLFNQNLTHRLRKPANSTSSIINSMFGNRMPALGLRT